MKKLISVLLFASVLSLCAGLRPASAQTFTLCNTTLNGSISASATTLVLTSASASSGCSFGTATAGQLLFIDAELIPIVSVSSTTMTVRRDPSARPTPHRTGAIIFRGPGNAYQKAEPPLNGAWNGGGAAGCSAYPAPWINVNTANVWFCNTVNNVWQGTNFRTLVYNSVAIAQ